MICPYCNKQVKIAVAVMHNLENYGGTAKARTACCKSLILVSRIITFKCHETIQKGKDDWGN